MGKSRARKGASGSERKGPEEGKLSASTELKVARIADIMRRVEWVRGETGKVLAKEWKVGENWVEKLAALASRRVRAELLEDKDHVGAQVGAALSKSLREASEKGDHNAVAKLAKIYSDAAGVSAAQKVETDVTHHGGPGIYVPPESDD